VRTDPAVVRMNAGKLLSGQPVTVKKMVDRTGAMKVRTMMKQAGAETHPAAVSAAPVRPATMAPAARLLLKQPQEVNG